MAQAKSGETANAADVLRGFFSKLTSMISTSPITIAKELFTQRVIALEVLGRVQSTSISPLDHATTIMMAVYNKVQAEGDEALGMFLKVLKGIRECARLATAIEQQRQSRGLCRWSKYML